MPLRWYVLMSLRLLMYLNVGVLIVIAIVVCVLGVGGTVMAVADAAVVKVAPLAVVLVLRG